MRIRPFLCLGVLGLVGLDFGSAAPFQATPAPVAGQPAGGVLEISFLFNKAEGVVPSYQIAIWLEDDAGKYVKTLFVSEYLAGPGMGLEVVCPDWVKQAHWDKVEDAEFDAATHPTPPVGVSTLKFDCGQRGILPGTYQFCVQAHINENYNIPYRGRISVGQDASEGLAEAFYSPRKHPLASEILYGVRAEYSVEGKNSATIDREKP